MQPFSSYSRTSCSQLNFKCQLVQKLIQIIDNVLILRSSHLLFFLSSDLTHRSSHVLLFLSSDLLAYSQNLEDYIISEMLRIGDFGNGVIASNNVNMNRLLT
jgi:hypothetical protein